MAQRIDDASKSQNNLKCDDSETTQLANAISTSANLLSTYVRMMKDDLNSFVSVLEEIQVTIKGEPPVKKEPLVKEKPSVKEEPPVKKKPWLIEKFWEIWECLKSFFKAIGEILTRVYHATSASLSSAGSKKKSPVSTIKEGAAKFCTADSGAFSDI